MPAEALAAASAASDARWRPAANPWAIAVVVTLAAFMEILDSTIVNVSLPHIAGSMSVSYDDATWTLTSYLVANGIVLPIAGWFGRLFGRKRYFVICILAFTLFSFLCGIATSLPQLIVFRLLQGFFGGGLQPSQQSIILDTFEPAQRGRAFSVVAVAVIFAPVIGPTFGGWITDTYSWRWVFLINVPVGVFAAIAVTQLVEDPPWVKRDRADAKDIDFIGLSLIALGLGSLQVMLDRGEDADWFDSPLIRLFGVVAAVGLIGAIVWLLLAKRPIVNLRVFADRNFAVGCLLMFAIGSILYATAVLIPQLVQVWYGYTAMLAGLVLSPGALLVLALIPFVARVLLPNVQTRFIVAFGFFSLGLALLLAHFLTPTLAFWQVAALRAAQSFGLAFLFVPNSTLAYSTLPRALNADASSLYVLLRNIAGSVGISLATATLVNRSQMHRAYLVDHTSPLDAPFNQMLAAIAQNLQAHGFAPNIVASTAAGLADKMLDLQAAMLAYSDIFTYTALAAFAMVPLTLLFRPSRPGVQRELAAGH
ncbi:MAG: DHA2 family efflux MFS transporter permease subunit [Acetobacteraceae bacterium]|nr:DHA2 family efflux MFS transporter permease subunit [Acetobacteraceae bacterium]